MRIKLRYFAMAREIMGKSAEEREVGPGRQPVRSSMSSAPKQSRLEAMKGSVLLMVNQGYVDPGHTAQRR